MELTDKQKASVAQWNSLGAQITENAMRNFLVSWFSNVRSLIKAGFAIHSVEELASRLSVYRTFTVLGSGPSIPAIARRFPRPHEAILCGPTCAGALEREGIRPAAIIVADSDPQQYQHILESRLFSPETLDVVLPVTADPLWYSDESILDRDHLFFYLPYLDMMGDTDIGFNHIFKSLFPEVHRWVAQAGSVGNLALNIADMCCGDSPDKRLYIGLDCSWIKGGPSRAPLRFDPSKHTKILQDFWAFYEKPCADLAELPFQGETIQTDLVSLGYAINLFYIIHSSERDIPFKKRRFALITDASKLYRATSPNIMMPFVLPEDTASIVSPEREEAWAYKVLLGLIEVSNNLLERLKKEKANAEDKTSVETGLGEGPEGDGGGKLQS
jgi:hypothetical protein